MIDPSTPITRYAGSLRTVVSQAGSLAIEANDQINDGTFDHAQWAKSAKQLANLALTAGLDVVPQLLSIPCGKASDEQIYLSEFIPVVPDTECQRSISIVESFVQDGAPSKVIPDHLIVFVPAVIRVYAKWFRVGTSAPNLQSGIYTGRVRLTRLKPPTPGPDEFLEVTVSL
jgi:hypothetical protein